MKLSEITEADVLKAAIEQIEKKDGYNAHHYFVDTDGKQAFRPGPHVGACCAIGGVEQAIWKLTKQIVTDQRGMVAWEENPVAVDRKRVSVLYAKVMGRLNRVTRKHYARYEANHARYEADHIEALTFVASKRVVLNAFRKALAEAQA